METALLAGIPPRLVDRALDLKQQLLQKETPPRETPLQVSPQETSLQFPPQGAPLEEPPPDLLTYFNSIQPKGTPSQNCARRKNGKPAFKALKDVKPLFKDLTGEMYFEGASKGGGAFIAIDAGSVPPPATVNRAYLYIFERKDGAFYVGEVGLWRNVLDYLFIEFKRLPSLPVKLRTHPPSPT